MREDQSRQFIRNSIHAACLTQKLSDIIILLRLIKEFFSRFFSTHRSEWARHSFTSLRDQKMGNSCRNVWINHFSLSEFVHFSMEATAFVCKFLLPLFNTRLLLPSLFAKDFSDCEISSKTFPFALNVLAHTHIFSTLMLHYIIIITLHRCHWNDDASLCASNGKRRLEVGECAHRTFGMSQSKVEIYWCTPRRALSNHDIRFGDLLTGSAKQKASERAEL
jgi:hypothetical protein